MTDAELARREYARACKLATVTVGKGKRKRQEVDREQAMRIARDNFNEILRGRRLDAELGPGMNVYNEATGRWEWRKA